MDIKQRYLQTFINIARNIAQLSTCAYRNVGAIIVKDNRIVSEGFNGTVSGFIHCIDVDSVLQHCVERVFRDKDDKVTELPTKLEQCIQSRLTQKLKTGHKYLSEIVSEFARRQLESLIKSDTSVNDLRYMLSSPIYRKQLNWIHVNRLDVHAEMNAITFAAKHGSSLDSAVLISTHVPCVDCLKAIVSTGIRKIYYAELYNDNTIYTETVSLARLLNVELIKV